MFARVKKLGAVLSLAALAGCAGRSVVPAARLTDPPKSDAYFVTTTSGTELEFVTLTSDGSALQGTVRTVQQRVVGQGDRERVESRNQYRDVTLPLAEVVRVEIRKGAVSPMLLAAAGAAVVGGAYLAMRGSGDDPSNGSDDGGGGIPPKK